MSFFGQNWTIANLILDLNFHKHQLIGGLKVFE
jgi:hypothetical protein